MRILVLAPRCHRGYFRMRLTRAGADVTFLVRPARAEVLSERGLRVLAPYGGEERIEPQLTTAKAIDGPSTSCW